MQIILSFFSTVLHLVFFSLPFWTKHSHHIHHRSHSHPTRTPHFSFAAIEFGCHKCARQLLAKGRQATTHKKGTHSTISSCHKIYIHSRAELGANLVDYFFNDRPLFRSFGHRRTVQKKTRARVHTQRFSSTPSPAANWTTCEFVENGWVVFFLTFFLWPNWIWTFILHFIRFVCHFSMNRIKPFTSAVWNHWA